MTPAVEKALAALTPTDVPLAAQRLLADAAVRGACTWATRRSLTRDLGQLYSLPRIAQRPDAVHWRAAVAAVTADGTEYAARQRLTRMSRLGLVQRSGPVLFLSHAPGDRLLRPAWNQRVRRE